jgi:hypothetical protein
MLTTVINFLIVLLILGLVFYLVIWVLGLLGIAVPTQVMRIIGAIIFLIILLWFLQAVLGGAHFPKLLMLPLVR